MKMKLNMLPYLTLHYITFTLPCPTLPYLTVYTNLNLNIKLTFAFNLALPYLYFTLPDLTLPYLTYLSLLTLTLNCTLPSTFTLHTLP